MIRDARNLPNKDKVIKFIKDRSCSRSGQTLTKVYCCDGEFPIDCKLRKLKNPNPSSPQLVGGVIPARNRKVRQIFLNELCENGHSVIFTVI